MVAENPHIVIHGAGSIGCWAGAAWIAAGLPISFVGRSSVAEEIAANGLTVTDSDRRRIELRPDEVDFSTSPTTLRKADIIALCVKSQATGDAAREIARHARKDAVVISFQNGVSNGEVLRRALPNRVVLQAMVPFNVARLGNGRWHKGVAGSLSAEAHETTRRMAERIGNGPGRLVLTDDIKGILWGKLLINLNNAVNALSGRPLLEQLSDRDYRRVVAASQIEALDILAKAGIEPAKIGPIPPRLLPHVFGSPNLLFSQLVLKRWRIDASARSSMADDIAAGRPTEIDHLNGEIVRLAHGMGRRAPVNEMIVNLIRQHELGVERTWGPRDLRDHVLGSHRAVPGFGY